MPEGRLIEVVFGLHMSKEECEKTLFTVINLPVARFPKGGSDHNTYHVRTPQDKDTIHQDAIKALEGVVSAKFA